MIEILFRGKTKQRNWVEGNGIMQGQDCISYARWVDICNDRTRYEVIPETVGRFTGLTDKNGKKIFEGDILKVWYSSDVIKGFFENLEVYYDEFYAQYMVGYRDLYEVAENGEVIGNIHDQDIGEIYGKRKS